MTGMKRCTCPEHDGPNPLPVTEFGRDSGRADGLNYWCKKCRNRAAVRSYRADPGKAVEGKRRYRAEHPEYRRAQNQVAARRSKRLNAASLDGAHHHRQPWTLPQLEIAARDDLTARQIAAMTGRTIRAVNNIRRKIKDDRYVDLNQMRQSLIGDLAATASGAGGNYDVFGQALSQQLSAGYAAVLGTPVAIPASRPDSDEPDPA